MNSCFSWRIALKIITIAQGTTILVPAPHLICMDKMGVFTKATLQTAGVGMEETGLI
jgi:hypothetical protein